MKKLKEIKYNEKDYFYENIFYTDYDYLFKREVINRGIAYYKCDYITNYKKDNNYIEATINNYKVNITFNNNKIEEVNCECKYHKDINKYCKHIYTLLIFDKLKDNRSKLIKIFNENINILINVKNNLEELFKVYKDKTYYLDFIKEDISKYISEVNSISNYDIYYFILKLYQCINNYIRVYNSLLDKYNKEKQIKKEKQIEDNTQKDINITYSFNEDVITDYCDILMSNVDSSILKKVRNDLIYEGKDTSIIDKAIMNSEIRENNEIREQNKKGSLLSILDLFDNKEDKKDNKLEKEMELYGLEEWQKELVRKGEYNPWNFEEEELEEDDYYYDDK